MIEIALSLAIIAFALVAIIGILPYGMGVQQVNREETIINQEGNILLEAVRNGAQGLDDLVNYVVAITNTQTWYPLVGKPTPPVVYGYTPTSSSSGGPAPAPQSPMSPQFPINNGFRIVGLLSTPKYCPVYAPGKQIPQLTGFYSNHVVATIRAMSGSAGDKAPQRNAAVREMAFTYRVIAEVIPYGSSVPGQEPLSGSSAWDQDWTNYTFYLNSKAPVDWQWRSNYYRYAANLQADLNDVRLLFRWPAFPNGTIGKKNQVIRGTTAGPLQPFVEPNFQKVQPVAPYTLYFVQPKTFVRAQ